MSHLRQRIRDLSWQKADIMDEDRATARLLRMYLTSFDTRWRERFDIYKDLV